MIDIFLRRLVDKHQNIFGYLSYCIVQQMSFNSPVIGINHPFSNFIENMEQIANVPVAARRNTN